MKTLLYTISLLGLLMAFNACTPYSGEQLSYIETSRPPQPDNRHIWLEGDWRWNRHRRTYEHQEGSWRLPRKDHTYVPGYWEQNRHGRNRWKRGRWH